MDRRKFIRQSGAAALYGPLQTAIKNPKGTGGKGGAGQANPLQLPPDLGAQFFISLAAKLGRPDLASMPWRSFADSQLGKEPAESLHVISIQLRTMLRESTPAKDVRPDPEKLQAFFDGVHR